MDDNIRNVVITLATFGLWGLVHSLTASLAVKRWGQARLGRRYYLYPFAYIVVSLVTFAGFLFFRPPIHGTVYSLDGELGYVLRGVQLLGVVGLLQAAREFDLRGFLGARDFRAAGASISRGNLRTSGLNAVVRHPLYFFGLVFLWANPRMTADAFWLTVAFSAYLVVGSVFEERKLVVLFGREYTEYKRAVSGLVPIKWLQRIVHLVVSAGHIVI
ncbi:MAG: methyltransferase family protein [Terriglobia bacterium]